MLFPQYDWEMIQIASEKADREVAEMLSRYTEAELDEMLPVREAVFEPVGAKPKRARKAKS